MGGGDGAFACAAARHAPQLAVQVFDLPGVVAGAAARFEQAGLATRCTAQGGDFFHDPLRRAPTSSRCCASCTTTTTRACAGSCGPCALPWPPGGQLLLAEPLADTPGAEAMGHAYFGFYLLAMGRGQPRSEVRLRELLAEAGFTRVRRLPTAVPLQASVLLADTE